MSGGFQRKIEKSLPLTKEIRSGIFVITLPEAELSQGAMQDFLPSMTLLDSAMLHMALSGIFGAGTNTNLFVDQRRKIVLFNGGVELANVDIDGHSGRMILNNIGFITVGADGAYLVLLVYPSTDVVEIYEELENALDKIRLSV